jgi:hypothetical protein
LVHCELATARVLQLILIACSRNVITGERSVQQRGWLPQRQNMDRRAMGTERCAWQAALGDQKL